MAEFSPELEDGERWLPANILNDVGARRRPSPLPFPFPASSDGRECFPRLAYFHALARELASLGHFHRRDVSTSPVFTPSPHYFVSGLPPARSVNNVVRSGAVRDRFMAAVVEGGCGSPAPSLRSAQMRVGSDRFPCPSPFQSHCSAFSEDIDIRKRPLGASKTGIMHRPAPSIHGQFASIPTAAPARENAGTGVFIPRIKIEKVNATPGCREQSEKKQGSSDGLEKEREKPKPLQPPVEHVLPRDWTY